jgi:site-specific DNA-methyltransferase (adenine-specific)
MPSPVRDRLSATYEVVYLLSRAPVYYFDLDAVRQPHTSRVNPARRPGRESLPPAWRGPNAVGAGGLSALRAAGRVGRPLGKNPGDVWRLASAGYRGAHFATFPRGLAERALRAGCPEARCQRCRRPWRRSTLRALGAVASRGVLRPGCTCQAESEPGLVLDPFMGAGTTAVAAEALGRDWLGIELNPDFAALAERRVAAALGQRAAA